MRDGLEIGMALSSGGAAGLAHVGVLEELLAAGVRIACVAGSSAGAVVGAAFAADHLCDFRDAMTALTRRSVMTLFDPIWPRAGLFRGRRAMNLIRPHVGARIEELPRRFAAVAADLHSGDEVVLRRGNVITALRASSAIPGLFAPQPWRRRLLVDGALVNPIPTNVARQLGAQFVIAVSVIATNHPAIATGPIGSRLRPTVGRWRTRFGACLRRGAPQSAAAEGTAAAMLPGHDDAFTLSAVLSKASAMIQANIAANRLRQEPPDYLIVPVVSDIGLFDFHRAAEAIAVGRAATRAILPELLATIERARAVAVPAPAWVRRSWDRGRRWFAAAAMEGTTA
jgi:NTE family protein